MAALLLIFVLFTGNSCFLLKDDSDFNLKNPGKVSSFSIYGRDTVEIVRDDQGWTMNQNQKPDERAVDNFLYAFQNIEILGASLGKAVDSLFSRKIIIKSGRKRSVFRFYTLEDNYFIHHEGSSKIFRIGVRSVPDANLDKVFSDIPGDWSKRLIISVPADELYEIEVIPEQGQGFIMEKDSTGFRVFNRAGKEVMENILNKVKTKQYSSYFTNIYFTEIINSDSISIRIADSEAFYEFNLKQANSGKSGFSVYPLYTDDGRKNLFYGALKLNGDERIYKVNYTYLDVLFQDLNYFYKE